MSKDILNEREFELVNIIGKKLGSNQRDLSRHMEMSLGMVNMLLRRLISKGYIRINQLNKRKVEYILTPKGFAEKMRKSVKYTLNTINSMGLIKKRLKEVLSASLSAGERDFYLLGESDFAILVEAVIREFCVDEYSISHIENVEKVEKGTVLICKEDFSNKVSEDVRCINLVEELAKEMEWPNPTGANL